MTPPPGLESAACDLCGSAEARPLLNVHDRIYGLPGEFTLVRCAKCGLIYLNPRPDRAHIGAYYPDLDYHAFRPPGALKSRILSSRRDKEAKSLLKGLPANPTVLEIGCGTGDLLAALQDQGAHAVGVEPNAAAAQAASDRHKLTVHVGMLDNVSESALPPCTFDLVLMKYALEHVHDPHAVMTRIAGLLRPGGRAVFWLPNAKSWEMRLFGARWRGLDAPRHLYIFTSETISRLAEITGLKVTQIDYSGVPNDWAGSLGFVLADSKPFRPLARWINAESLPALATLWPISFLAAVCHAAGRMKVTVGKE